MARPLKQGLDYFPLDTILDEKIEMIEAEHGLIGFAIVIKLWQKIYSDKGYYYEWREKERLLFAKNAGIDLVQLDKIIESTIKWEIFDADLFFEHKILTSERTQMTFANIIKSRKQANVVKNYALIDFSSELINAKTELIYKETIVNRSIKKQSKVKESKVKKKLSDLPVGKSQSVNVIFQCWIEQSETITHQKLTRPMIKTIQARLNDYSEDQITNAIRNYNKAIANENYFWSYSKWTLDEFLKRGEGRNVDKFQNIEGFKKTGENNEQNIESEGREEIYGQY